MISKENMRFYVEPSVNQGLTIEEVYVLDTRHAQRQEMYIGKIVPVMPRRSRANGRDWNLTTDGEHMVYGAPLVRDANQISNYYGPVLAEFGDGFIVGRSHTYTGRTTSLVVTEPRFSESNQLEAVPNDSLQLPVKWLTPAASWAYELMPLPTDDAATVEAKLNLAKENYKQRRAFNHLHEESISRGWGETMTELMESNDYIPKAKIGLLVTANVLVGVPRRVVGEAMAGALIESAKQEMGVLPGEDNSQNHTPTVGVLMQRKFSIDTTYDSQEDAQSTAAAVHVRNYWGRRSSAALSNFTSEPVLAGLAN